MEDHSQASPRAASDPRGADSEQAASPADPREHDHEEGHTPRLAAETPTSSHSGSQHATVGREIVTGAHEITPTALRTPPRRPSLSASQAATQPLDTDASPERASASTAATPLRAPPAVQQTVVAEEDEEDEDVEEEVEDADETVLPFGGYKGMSYGDVYERHPGYCD